MAAEQPRNDRNMVSCLRGIIVDVDKNHGSNKLPVLNLPVLLLLLLLLVVLVLLEWKLSATAMWKLLIFFPAANS